MPTNGQKMRGQYAKRQLFSHQTSRRKLKSVRLTVIVLYFFITSNSFYFLAVLTPHFQWILSKQPRIFRVAASHNHVSQLCITIGKSISENQHLPRNQRGELARIVFEVVRRLQRNYSGKFQQFQGSFYPLIDGNDFKMS